MKVKQLVKLLQGVNQNLEVVLCTHLTQYGAAQVSEHVGIFRIYDVAAKNGERQVFLLQMKDYGEDEYELILQEGEML